MTVQKSIFATGLLLAATVCFPFAARADEVKKPNIIVIMADDMGYSDIGCYGGEVQTPNLDKLANNGVRFKNFFNTARCCPTRAALMTGLYSHQAGVGHMTQPTKYPGYQGELNRNCVTIAEVLRMFGYGCYMSGKWHLSSSGNMAKSNPTWPRQRGYDRFFGTITGAGSFYTPSTLTLDNTPIQPTSKDFYYTDAISDHAVKFMVEHRQKRTKDPFFMYVAYTSPHWPLHALKDDIAKYSEVYQKGWDVLRKERHERMKKIGLVEPEWEPSKRDKEIPAWDSLSKEKQKEMAHKMAVYAAQIDRMDQGIGKIVKALDNAGELDNTLILFLADNGGCAEGGIFGFERKKGGVVGEDSSFASYGQGWAWLSNAIFRLYKHWTHAGGVSSPLIIHWPQRTREKGIWRRQHGHVIDVMATCIDAAGATYPTKYHDGKKITPLEGKSLLPALENKAVEREAIYWEHEGNRAVLRGKWKLVSKYPGGWELYDIEADRAEMNNLAKKQPQRVQELAQLWQAWADRSQVVPWSEYTGRNKNKNKNKNNKKKKGKNKS